jgi:anti-sigma regulatory factor (Ser/Thr protein kinase)
MTSNHRTEKVHLTIPATFGYEDYPAAVAKAWTRKISSLWETADKAHHAVMEICLNAIEHGSDEDPAKRVNIELFELDDALVVEISDTGKGFTPLILKEFRATPENRRGGGLFMVYKWVDELELQPSAGKRKFPDHLKMAAKKSDFLEKSDFSTLSVPPKNGSQEIRFFGKIGFRGGLGISAILH